MAAPPLSAAPSGAAPPVSSSRKPRVSHTNYLPTAQTIRVLQCRTRQRRPRSRKFTGNIQSEDENLCFSIEPTAIRSLQNTPEISTITSSSFGVLVATIHGSIHLLDPQFAIAESWIAHVNGRVTHMAERKGILITLGVSFISFPFLGDEDANIFIFIGFRRKTMCARRC